MSSEHAGKQHESAAPEPDNLTRGRSQLPIVEGGQSPPVELVAARQECHMAVDQLGQIVGPTGERRQRSGRLAAEADNTDARQPSALHHLHEHVMSP